MMKYLLAIAALLMATPAFAQTPPPPSPAQQTLNDFQAVRSTVTTLAIALQHLQDDLQTVLNDDASLREQLQNLRKTSPPIPPSSPTPFKGPEKSPK